MKQGKNWSPAQGIQHKCAYYLSGLFDVSTRGNIHWSLKQMKLVVAQITVVVTKIKVIMFLLRQEACLDTEVPKHMVLLANENAFPWHIINTHNVDIAEYLV